jgi:hypothetical protein
MALPYGLDPYANDPGGWGASLLCHGELLLACLDAATARSVVEVGAYAGDLTQLLLRWGAERDARVAAIDPQPQPALERLAEENATLTLIRRRSLDVLGEGELAGAYILDGDHNHFTVTHELRAIARLAAERQAPLPLVLLHDVCWPHGRRDDYYDPEQIPAEARQPTSAGGLYPGRDEVVPGALPYRHPAAHEGGRRNGVLTAAEDFVAADPGLRLMVIPAFFGLGVIFPVAAPWAEPLVALLAPWDRHPLLERLEANRVLHLASANVQFSQAQYAQVRLAEAHGLLEAMLHSRAFAAAELFLRVRQRGRPAFSRRAVRQALGRVS